MLNSFLCRVKSQGSSFYSACDYVIFPVLFVEEKRIRRLWLSVSRSSTWFHQSLGVFCARVTLTRHRGSVVYRSLQYWFLQQSYFFYLGRLQLFGVFCDFIWILGWFFSIPVKTTIGDLMVIALNLNVALNNVAVFTILIGSISPGAWEVFKLSNAFISFFSIFFFNLILLGDLCDWNFIYVLTFFFSNQRKIFGGWGKTHAIDTLRKTLHKVEGVGFRKLNNLWLVYVSLL